MSSQTSSIKGTLHQFSDNPELTCFEHDVAHDSPGSNVIVVIPGLNGSYPPVPYTEALSQHLQNKLDWTIVELGGLSSAGPGYGAVTVFQDAKEIGLCVRFLRQVRHKTKIVLMGHSTGCQDAVAYCHLNAQEPNAAPPVEGIILQAPVSDREFIINTAPISIVPLLITQYPGLRPHPGQTYSDFVDRRLSNLFGTKLGITYTRWNSLVSKAESDKITWANEDYFSSDMTTKRWSNVFEPMRQNNTRTLIVLSGKDESYGPTADLTKVDKLKGLFGNALSSQGSGGQNVVVLPEADHAVSDEDSRSRLFETVTNFLSQL
ncbi:hypothetical protein OIO90_001640 [Microbotryomycetes sp. JL221]|nr:hypothetical protein OIO90_001640 [Microbotryomycetes sp. JL221]